MKNKLPDININQKYIKLNIKSTINPDEAKLNKINSLFNNNYRKIFIKPEKNKDKFKFSRYTNMKIINLTSLVNQHPKNLRYPQFLMPKKNLNKSSNSIIKRKTFYKFIPNNSSAKFLSTNSKLNRLSKAPEEIGELEKFEYYDKIERTKSYQNFLKKEKEVIPKDSVDNSFMEDSNEDEKNKDNKRVFLNLMNTRKSVYDLLYLFNPKNMVKLRPKFNNKEQFEKYIIEKFVKEKRQHLEDRKVLNKNVRNIFIILDGDIIINENYIKGFFIELPHLNQIESLNKRQRKLMLNNIIKKSEKNFNTNKPLINIFSPDKQFISDVSEIKENFDYLYVSTSIICLGTSIITTRNLMEIYDNDFRNELKENIEKMKDMEKEREELLFKKQLKQKAKYKVKKVIKGIRPKYERYKPHYSFADGENNLENADYIIYSDDEGRKKSKEKKILKYCYRKNDFFLYLNENDLNKRTLELKKNLKFTETYNLKKNYKKFDPSFETLLKRYKSEIFQQMKINPKIFKVDPIDSKINSHNIEFPEDKLNNLYISRRDQKKIKFRQFHDQYLKKNAKNNKALYDPFYYNMHRNINKYYNPFVLYNIPKLLSEFKNFTRKRLYELYSKYKDLITMSYSKNKSKFILQNGVDFETFWQCIENFATEKKEFATKIYNQINRREICFLSLEDFLTGMYYMQNSDLTKKLDIFLKMLDKTGKGSISFNEAVTICKESIQRNFGEKGDGGKNENYALNQMSEFFASFVFQLIGVDKRNNLNLEELRNAVISKESELNEFEYLEMFCGANI